MPTMRISDTNWTRLQAWAVPLVDSPDDAFGKVLDEAETSKSRAGQNRTTTTATAQIQTVTGTKHSKKLPESAYETPIVEALVSLGGKGRVADVLEIVYGKIKHLLTDYDYAKLKGGEIRWRNTAMWERKKLISRGVLRNDSPRGYWELSGQRQAPN